MTTATANRIARITDKAQQAGWDVTHEQDGNWSYVYLTTPDGYRYTVGSRDTDGNRGRTYVVRSIGSIVANVTLRTLESDAYCSAARAAA
jgi:hypothetical protein